MPSRASSCRPAISSSNCIRFDAVQVADHLVEAVVGFADFTRAALGQRIGAAAIGNRACRRRQARQRLVDEAGDHHRTQQRQQQRGGAPAQPLNAGTAVDAAAVQHQPVFVVGDREADPEAGNVVDGARKARVRTESVAHGLLDALHHAGVDLRFDLVGIFQRIDAYAFVAGEVEQQFAPQIRRRMGQRRARNGHQRNDLRRDLIGARRLFDHAEAGDPCRHAACDQEGEQEESAPEQAALDPYRACGGRHALSSGGCAAGFAAGISAACLRG
jgi:hypothetical protein